MHSTRDLASADVTVVDGIPTTAPARTIIDVVATLVSRERGELVDRAIVTGLVRAGRLSLALARALTRRGAEGVRSCSDSWRAPSPRTRKRSQWVRGSRFGSCSTGPCPRPRVNHRVRSGGRVRYLDLAWPEFMVAVELDGFVPHSTRACVFDDDRARQNSLVAEGWTVFRLTWTALERDPGAALAPILAALAAHGAGISL